VTEFKISTQILSPPERVWAVMRDVVRWREWTPTVKSIRILKGDPLVVGSRLLIRQPKLPPAVWKIVQLEEGTGFESVTGTPLVRVTARHSLRAETGGTVVTLSIRFSGLLAVPVARLTRRLNEEYLALEANGLKKKCENQ
jgi:ligand-binding SRPBCC domain-containing protein